MRLAVTIPTRNRPAAIERCLDALAAAREEVEFVVYVCDSSSAGLRPLVRDICTQRPWTVYTEHDSPNAAAARNFCAKVADADVLVTLDDDVYVEPDSIAALLSTYQDGNWDVVAGTVAWRNGWGILDWSTPKRIALGGHSFPAETARDADYVLSAFLLYSREFALAVPWPEQLATCEDLLQGLRWSVGHCRVGFEPKARAKHDEKHSDRYEARSLGYVVLYREIVMARSIPSALVAFVLGGILDYRFRGVPLPTFISDWLQGGRQFVRDRSSLKAEAQQLHLAGEARSDRRATDSDDAHLSGAAKKAKTGERASG